MFATHCCSFLQEPSDLAKESRRETKSPGFKYHALPRCHILPRELRHPHECRFCRLTSPPLLQEFLSCGKRSGQKDSQFVNLLFLSGLRVAAIPGLTEVQISVFSKALGQFFIVVKYTWSLPWVAFGTFTVRCNHHLCLVAEHLPEFLFHKNPPLFRG